MYNEYSNKRNIIITILLTIITVCIILLIFLNNDNIIKNNNEIEYDLTKNKGGLPQPIQTTCQSSNTSIQIDKVSVNVTKVAQYKIIGRVGSIGYHYGITNIQNKLSTRDFQLAYGEIALDKNFTRIKFTSSNRFGVWYCNNQDFYKEYGSYDIIQNNVSNNHIVPATKEIKNAVEKVKVGDVVDIEGYLATFEWSTDRGRYYWGTSTTRNDTGDGACETIYVEKFNVIQ